MTNDETATENATTLNEPAGQTHAVDYFGGCPHCGYHDGYLNVGRAHWFVCHEHRTKWCGGDNLFSGWWEQPEDEWNKNAQLLVDYVEVEPLCPLQIENPRQSLPKPVIVALEAILNAYQPQAQTEYVILSEARQCGHVCESLALVYGWLNGIAEPVRYMRMHLRLHRQTANLVTGNQ